MGSFIFVWIDFISLSVTTTISPGFTFLSNSAPVKSKAQLSDANTYSSSFFPIQRGLNPWGSLTATIFLEVITINEYEPLKRFIAFSIASSIEFDFNLSCTMM